MGARRHAAVPVNYDGRDECSVCGADVDRTSLPYRHVGEVVPIVAPEPEDARAFARAVDLAEATLATMPKNATAADAARLVVETIYDAGHLRRRPARPPRPRDSDPAEAARAIRERYERPDSPLARVG